MVNTTRIKDIYRSLELQGTIDAARSRFLGAMLTHKTAQLQQNLAKSDATEVEKEAWQAELEAVNKKQKLYDNMVVTSLADGQRELVALVRSQNKLKKAQDPIEEKMHLADVEASLFNTEATLKKHAEIEAGLSISFESLKINLKELSPGQIDLYQEIKLLEGLQKKECNPALSVEQEIEAVLNRIRLMKIEKITSHQEHGTPYNSFKELTAIYESYKNTEPKTDESLMKLSHAYAKYFRPLLQIMTLHRDQTIDRQPHMQDHDVKTVDLAQNNELNLLQKEYNNKQSGRKKNNIFSRFGLTAKKLAQRIEIVIAEAEKFKGPSGEEAYKKLELQHISSMNKASIYAYVGEGTKLITVSKSLQKAYKELGEARENKDPIQTQQCLLNYLLQRKKVEEGFKECEHRASAHAAASKQLGVIKFMEKVQEGMAEKSESEAKLTFLAEQFQKVDDNFISSASEKLRVLYQKNDKKDFFDRGVLNQVLADPSVYLQNKIEDLIFAKQQDEANQWAEKNKKPPGLFQKFLNLFVDERRTHLALKSRRRVEGIEKEIHDIQDLLLQILTKSMSAQSADEDNKLDQVHSEGEQKSSRSDHKVPAPAPVVQRKLVIEPSPLQPPLEKEKKTAKNFIGAVKKLVGLGGSKKLKSSTATMEVELSTVTHQVRIQPQKSGTATRRLLFNTVAAKNTLFNKVVQKVKDTYNARKQKRSPHANVATEMTTLTGKGNQKSYDTMTNNQESPFKNAGKFRRFFSVLKRR